jgi:hypothetical protein
VLKWEEEELFVAFASNRALDDSNNKTNMHSNCCAKIPNKTQSEVRNIVIIRKKDKIVVETDPMPASGTGVPVAVMTNLDDASFKDTNDL